MLPDGREVTVRHIMPDDDELLIEFYRWLSPETRRLRFFVSRPMPDAATARTIARRYAVYNPAQHAMLVAVCREAGVERALGVANFAVDPAAPTAAELAIVVRDDEQRCGLGRALLDLLIQVALTRGIQQLRARSFAGNSAVQRLIKRAGFPVQAYTSAGETLQTITLQDP